jgi:hypothetical protein
MHKKKKKKGGGVHKSGTYDIVVVQKCHLIKSEKCLGYIHTSVFLVLFIWSI